VYLTCQAAQPSSDIIQMWIGPNHIDGTEVIIPIVTKGLYREPG
jgi:hypothetical protein